MWCIYIYRVYMHIYIYIYSNAQIRFCTQLRDLQRHNLHFRSCTQRSARLLHAGPQRPKTAASHSSATCMHACSTHAACMNHACAFNGACLCELALSFWVLHESLETVDEVSAVKGVSSDSHASGLSQTHLGRLADGLIS